MASKPGSARWASLDAQVEELRFEPAEAHSFCFFSADAIDWSAPLADSVWSPAHVAALAANQHRIAFEDDESAGSGGGAPRHTSMRGLGALAVIDITDTTHVMRWPWRQGRGATGVSMATATATPLRSGLAPDGTPPPLFDLGGHVVRRVRADDAVLATSTDEAGQVVVGYRGQVQEIEDAVLSDMVSVRAGDTVGHRIAATPQPTPTSAPAAFVPASTTLPPPSVVTTAVEPLPLVSNDSASSQLPIDISAPILLTMGTTLFAKDLSDDNGMQKYLIQKNALLALKVRPMLVDLSRHSRNPGG